MGTTVSSGVTSAVSNTVVGIVVDSGGTLDVVAGGAASSTVLNAGASETIVSGGRDARTLIAAGASETVLSGAYAFLATISGAMTIGTSGTLDGGTVGALGSLLVSSGGTAFDVGLAAGTETVLPGGVDQAADVTGGSFLLESGASAIGMTLTQAGALTIEAGGVMTAGTLAAGVAITISSGVVFDAMTATSGGSITVARGGIDSGARLDNNVTETVFGVAIGTELMVGAGDRMLVASGGVASNVYVEGAYYGAGANTLTVAAGGVAVAPNAVGYPGGAVIVSSGGVDSAGGYDVTLEAGGSMVAGNGGTAWYFSIDSGATLRVGPTLGASAGTVQSGGSLIVASGGLDDTTTLLGGASATVLSGGTADATIILGSATVLSGGVAAQAQVSSGGNLLVTNGGTAFSTDVLSGGTAVIAAGAQEIVNSGPANSLTVQAGGSLTVASGGVATAITALGGTLVVSARGALDSATVAAGGSLTVVSGGAAFAVVAAPGGVALFVSGATASSDGVSGGTLVLQAGAVAAGGLVFQQYGYGGDMVIEGTALPTVPISGFGGDETIDLPNIPFDPAGTISVTGSGLTFAENGFDYSLSLVSAGLVGRAPILARDATGGTAIEVPCFAAGTRIATPGGDVAVERLRPGDAVLTLGGAAWRARRVRWVGTVAIDLRQHPRPHKAAPYRILAGAFAEGIPTRDLLVSPDHALLVDGVLVQAQALANGATIAQQFPTHVTYWHIELDEHAILCAEGLPAESYRDTGNRAQFAGAAGVRPLHPDLSGGAAPMVLAGPHIAAAHARLMLRAVSLGYRLTQAPALALIGSPSPRRCGAGRWHLAAHTRALRLESRVFVPAWFGADDRRRLGIGVRDVRLGGETLAESAFTAGWHAAEDGFRWTDGAGRLRLPPLPVPAMLTVELAAAGQRYWVTGTDTAASAAA